MPGEKTLTFLFTDIEASTHLWEQQPAAMRRALERHNDLLNAAISGQGGRVFQTAGDAFSAVFETASAALAAAVQAQQALYGEAWELEYPLQVRMVLHTGQAEPSGADFMGGSLNRLGRMLDVCHGGQTLLSLATEELVRDYLPEGVTLRDLGQHRFRDLVSPERIFQVEIAGLPDQFPPLLSLDATPNNLPVQLTRWIGRERELDEVIDLLDSTPLLTLTGPGGTGKTRLALQAAAQVLPRFSGGAWLVELAPLADPGQIVQSVASVFAVREPVGRPWLEALIEELRSRSLLLVLDNCEHLIEACADFATSLLRLCPGVKVIASSREPLGIAGESIYRVPSLSLPPVSASVTLDDLLKSEAVSLFVDRACRVQPHFRLNERNAPAVEQICRRLDGIPLALELAAARMRLFSAEQIAARLDDRFRLLTGGSRSALPRQQTLEALIDWSYELLSPAERGFFCRLSVFAGGWTYEAAERVWAEGNNPESRPETMELLDQLVNKSLVQAEEDPETGEVRYRSLETIRQYAGARLLAAGETQAARDAHLAFFADLTRQADLEQGFSLKESWKRRLQSEHDNIRLALEWAIERDPYLALRVAGDISLQWARRGYASEGEGWLRAAMSRCSRLEAETSPLAEQPERIRLHARAFNGLAFSFIAQGRYAQAITSLEQSLELWPQTGDRYGYALALGLVGMFRLISDVNSPVVEAAQKALDIALEINSPIAAMALVTLGMAAVRQEHDPAKGMAYFQQADRYLLTNNNEWIRGITWVNLGISLYRGGDLKAGKARLLESQRIFQAIGDLQFLNVANSELAHIVREEGDYSLAIQLYVETIGEWRILGNPGGIARCLECLAFTEVAQARRQPAGDRGALLRLAGLLLGAADSIRQANHARMMDSEPAEYEQQLAALKALDEGGAAKAAFAEGHALNMDQVVALAKGLASERLPGGD